jgi:hypothetical protein
MAPQGQGPLGGTLRSLVGIQPVEPIRQTGNADILATLAPERDQKSRKRMAQARSTPVIVAGNPDAGKVTKAQAL